MTVETTVKCPHCGKEAFARYGSSGWAQWQVCPHCGLAELDGEEGLEQGDEALRIFFNMCQSDDIEVIREYVEKYFSGDGSEEPIFTYSEEEIEELLQKRESLNFCDDEEPYVVGLLKRLKEEGKEALCR